VSVTDDAEAGLRLPSPIEEIADDRLAAHGVRLLLKRDDLIHPEMSGNKWRKLKHNLVAAAGQGRRTVLTFGGAYSNHIRATAFACHRLGFAAIGVIRGEEHLPLNAVLAAAAGHGMTLTYLDRASYRRKHEPEIAAALLRRFGDVHVVPEGGGNSHGLRGCAELPAELPADVDVVCCASGTGTTLAGMATTLAPGQRAIGFSALKGGDFLRAEVRRLQQAYGHVTGNWSVETEFHFGGYARRSPDLEDFIADFRRRHGVTLDGVYEAKMMYGIVALAGRGRFRRGTTLVAVIA
jgi:1-aminocyclopropane-1-carboxylate deaminase